MRRVARWTGTGLVVLACVAYQYLVHSSVSDARAGALYLVLMWLPLALLAIWAMVRSGGKLPWLTALSAVGVLVYLAEQHEGLGLVASSGTTHAAVYLFLLWYFGRTLLRGREPMITRFARRVHGTLPPDMEALTRQLTVAWCVFFAAQLIVSGLLYALAPLGAWSLFVNVLNFPLVVLMFVFQAVYRNLLFPDCPRASIWQAIQAFSKDASYENTAGTR